MEGVGVGFGFCLIGLVVGARDGCVAAEEYCVGNGSG